MTNEIYHIQKKKFLIIGDVMLDTYYIGDVNRISPEAPVPIFSKKAARNILGGAANVAVNVAAANQDVSIMSVIGNDSDAEIVEKLLYKNQIDTSLLFHINRHTTVKTRFLASNHQQIMRMDVEETDNISVEQTEVMLEKLKKQIRKYDLIIMSDYLKGLLTYEFTQQVIDMANEINIPVIIDVKDPNIDKYVGAYLVKPNLLELRTLTGMPADSDDKIIEASESLRKKCNCQYVLTTCGARGMILVGSEMNYKVEPVGKEVFDVTGAGDTTIAYFAVCLANQISMQASVEISNYAAGLQVGKVGTSTIKLSELMEVLMKENRGSQYKLLNESAVSVFRQSHPKKKIVFTNGCFDILHAGHIRYLKEASALGDLLVVGLNSDISVKRLKGADRPINEEKERAELLCSLEYVDYVVIFSEDTPYHLIQQIQPDVLVKGGDYKPDEVVGKDFVETRGGTLKIIPFVEGKSTTKIIDSIKNRN